MEEGRRKSTINNGDSDNQPERFIVLAERYCVLPQVGQAAPFLEKETLRTSFLFQWWLQFWQRGIQFLL